MLLLCALIVGSSAWATDVTYTFTSKSWGDSNNAWTSGKDGNQLSSGRGVQVTTGASGANATTKSSFSNVSKVTVTYSTNANDGAGSISIQVGSNTAISKNVTKSGGTTDRTLEYDFSPAQTGTVKITVTCTTNSIYVKSVTITYSNKTPAGLTFDTHENETYTVLPSSSFTPPTLSNPNSLSVSYGTSDADIADVNSSTGEITIGTKEGTATITASSAETDTYAAGSAKYKIKVEKGTSTVTLNNSALSFNIVDGITQTLTGTPKYNDVAIENATVTWSVVSGSSYVSVSNAGVVTALAPGSATIRASYAGSTVYKSSTADCAVTVNKANTAIALTTSDPTTIDLKPANNATVRLNAAVNAIKTDESQVTVENPTVTWASSDETIATVDGGVVTGLKVGTTTITASYAGGTNYNAAANQTCEITVVDTRTAVNMETFTATNSTIIIGGSPSTTATAVTTDQNGWTPAYSYLSSNTSVATVAADGTVTAVAKGTATITATLNVDANDANYKAGEITSKTLEITVNKPSHTVTFSVNGNTDRTASVEEDQPITFPTAADTPADASQFDKVINGQTFVGWYTDVYSNASVAPLYVNTASTTMGNADVTYYAVYADYVAAVHDYVEDVLTPTGASNPSSYGDWSNKTFTSDAVYAGNSTGGTTRFQLNSDSPRGIVSTVSGGRVAKITLAWNSSTSSGRTVDVYGKNSAYTGPVNLHNSSNQGTLLGSIVYNNTTELVIDGDYTYIGLRSRSNALYINSITVKWDKGTPASYSHFNTTVSALPRPEITMADVEMTWGDNDKSVAPTATVAGEAYEGTFIYESSSANLTVASDGKLTCNVPGAYTVTAKIAATGSYQAAEKTCNVTVSKQNITLSFADAEVIKMVTDETYTQTATVSPVAYDGTVTYSREGNATINSSTAKVDFTTTGVNTITATAPATSLYNGNTASYTLYVKTTPTITVSDQTKAIGETYTPTITGGTVTITCDPAGIASVDGNVITAAAIGTATVTVATAANDTYVAGQETFTLTVNGAPTGLTALPEPEAVTVFYESFTGTTGSIDSGWGNTSGGGETIYKDNTGWNLGDSNGGAGNAVKLGASKTNGTATTPSISVTSGTVYSLTFKAAPWATESTSMSLTVTGGTATGLSTSNMTPQQWNNLSASITASSSTMSITFDASANRFFLDEVRLTGPGDQISSVSATIPEGRFASYCSLYPLDLPADNDNYAAYIVKEVSGTNVTFKKISGEIKGGVPFILYGTPGDYNLPTAASSDEVPANNMLTGTLAPTFVSSDADNYCFGVRKSDGKFVKISGVLPANKAYLTVAKSVVDGAGSRELSIIFEDEVTTGINNVSVDLNDNNVYDMQGRKVNNPKSGLYIVNGRKVVIK